MAGEELIKRAREQMALLNAKDWKRYRSFLADEAVLDEEATHRRVSGPDEIIKVVKGWVEAFPDLTGKEVSAFASGDTVILEVIWEGTHKGPLAGPMGSIAASGKKAKLSSVQVIRFEGDKIAETRHYFDLMTLLQQIGVAPEMAAQP